MRVLRLLVGFSVMIHAAPGGADCPDDDALGAAQPACEPIDRFLAVSGTASRTSLAGDRYTGLGGALSLVTWRHPGPGPGPSHGDLALGATYLQPDDYMRHGVVTLHASIRMSFERAATRAWMIPYWTLVAGRTFTLGAAAADAPPEHLFAAPGVGVYVLWYARPATRVLMQLAVQATYRMPLGDWDALRGFETTAALVSSWQ